METNPKQLAAQLRKPEGEFGKKVALELNKTNRYITAHCYNHIPFSTNQTIVEIGPGNGVLMQELLKREPSLKLHGIDFSQDMVDEANALNSLLVSTGQMKFSTAGVSDLPLEDDSVNHIGTINTLYFWPTPTNDIKELIRVLKPGGTLTIAIRPKNEMENLEVTQYGFQYYTQEEVEELLAAAGFTNINSTLESDPPIEFDGETFVLHSLIVQGTK